MGENFYGIHYRSSSSAGKGIYICSGRQADKFVHFFAIPTEYKAIQVVELFFIEVFRLHGLPRQIISDRDGCFISVFWQELFKLVSIELAMSANHHP
jgi:hypothetical protein